MKHLILIIPAVLLLACNQQADTKALENRVDSLEKQISNSYKPGLGEFMSDIQVHHNKLWFAGVNQNWKLADFEINEIKESLEFIKKYCTDRPEVQSIGMIDAPLDSLNTAIQEKNLPQFKASFTVLTNTCNNCHHATAHEFNVIKIPDTPPFSNQDFKLQDKK